MEHILNFEDFLNEADKPYKDSKGETSYSNVNIPGFDPTSSVNAGKECATLAAQLVNYWEKGKKIDSNKFFIRDEKWLNPDKLPRENYSFTVISRAKPTKDLRVEVEFRDGNYRGEVVNELFVKIYRVG
jgi:hypothetical protein